MQPNHKTHSVFNQTFSTLLCQQQGAVGIISLNRQETLNAFNKALRYELLSVIQQLNALDNIRVVILTGQGNCFSAGADLNEIQHEDCDIEQQITGEYLPILQAIRHSDKTYIAAVQGAAAGIASALAMNCDLMMMAENAYIYQAFAAIGLIPDGGASWHLLHNLGYKKAYELILSAGKISADECLAYGLANRVVAKDELMDKSLDWAKEIASGSPLAGKYLKQLLNQAANLPLEEMIRTEAACQKITFASDDFNEGLQAFFQKRKPVFHGH